MSSAIGVIGNSIAAVALGEAAGLFSKAGSQMVRANRRKVGESLAGSGPGIPDSTLT